MRNIVLLGAPGAGKDTLATHFQNTFKCNMITPGAIFRREAELGTPLGIKAKAQYWGKGLICPDDMTIELVKNTLVRLSKKKVDLNVFNGFPRSLVQAVALEEMNPVDIAFDLSVTKETATKRLLARRREDDTEEVIEQRFSTYLENNTGIVEFYKEKGVYRKVNANQMASRVLRDAMKIIGESNEDS